MLTRSRFVILLVTITLVMVTMQGCTMSEIKGGSSKHTREEVPVQMIQSRTIEATSKALDGVVTITTTTEQFVPIPDKQITVNSEAVGASAKGPNLSGVKLESPKASLECADSGDMSVDWFKRIKDPTDAIWFYIGGMVFLLGAAVAFKFDLMVSIILAAIGVCLIAAGPYPTARLVAGGLVMLTIGITIYGRITGKTAKQSVVDLTTATKQAGEVVYAAVKTQMAKIQSKKTPVSKLVTKVSDSNG